MAMDDRLRAGFGHGLDEYDILHQLSLHRMPVRMGDLADRLLVANSSCNRIVGRLVDAELVIRTQSELDGRVVLVSLTSAGKRLRRRMATAHARDIDIHFSSLLDVESMDAFDVIVQRLLVAQEFVDAAD